MSSSKSDNETARSNAVSPVIEATGEITTWKQNFKKFYIPFYRKESGIRNLDDAPYDWTILMLQLPFSMYQFFCFSRILNHRK